ncbi:MAG TPA: hypothetical protein VH298_01730 [Jatrophihabitans sp.]|nr:hypothetical protein [Jatrophihabitans sp.]
MSMRTRLITLAVVCLLAIGGAVAYLIDLHGSKARQVANAPTVSVADPAALNRIAAAAHIVFRSTALGADYGKLAMVSLADPSGARALTGTSCDRDYAAAAKILCLSSEQGVVTTYRAEVLGANLQGERSLPLAGIPSRARLSVDGTLAATTSFTAGDSYAGTSFSTRTVISGIGPDGAASANLEDFKLIHNGAAIKPIDRNFWGVTFARDDNTFYATAAWGGHTYLVRGDRKARTVTTIHSDAECPSLSPDGSTIVYKKRNGQPAGHWRLASYRIATGTETLLGETRTVDDQVDWLDNNTVIYGIPRSGSQAAIDDIYAVPADGSGTPKLLIAQAWSPAVVH